MGFLRPLSRTNKEEEAMSLFFDFNTAPSGEPQTSVSSEANSPTESRESTPRPGGIRVSLACIPCRSRHVKCGAEMPNCGRCVQDDKPCFYAKSRRGMRDRNAPRKRANMKETTRVNPIPGGHNIYSNNSLAYSSHNSSESYSRPSSEASASPESSSSKLSGRQGNPKHLLDLYYNYFHKAHPFVLPRYCFLARLDTDSESLKYLLPVMQYIGSLYAPDISSFDLRETALNQLDMPGLPPNGFTVLALLLMGIALHSEDEFGQGRSLLDRGIYMALEIRMNSRTFANMERDPVLAESWRRTYWGLYITDAMISGITRSPNFILHSIESNVELPCEEYDYDGIIPRPHTLSEYETRDFEDDEPVFSSFTYLIDICRISGTILGLQNLGIKDLEPAVANADAMLVNWKLHLPREKQGVVDRNEDVDEVLFQAHNMLQWLMVLIHRPLSRLYHCPIESISSSAPPFPSHEINNKNRSLWLHTKKCLEASEIAVNLYTLPIPILQHSPLGIHGVALSTLANLSACAYVLHGAEWHRTRDRIRLGLGGLKKMGEVWATSRRTERETKRIVRGVFSLPPPGEMGGHSIVPANGQNLLQTMSSVRAKGR
ncbi:hypothetical protein B0O99DRAFT_660909 [Bisporella sp. PMI_857]|nr:hypothetical protein B0O99DRAFT_660909 [Bisporella sp. PMI_857]